MQTLDKAKAIRFLYYAAATFNPCKDSFDYDLIKQIEQEEEIFCFNKGFASLTSFLLINKEGLTLKAYEAESNKSIGYAKLFANAVDAAKGYPAIGGIDFYSGVSGYYSSLMLKDSYFSPLEHSDILRTNEDKAVLEEICFPFAGD